MRRLSLLIAAVAGLAPVGLAALAPPARAEVPKNATWKSTEASAIWNNGGYVLGNNMLATAAAGSQTIWAFSYRNWGVESSQPATAGVKSYPYVGRRYPGDPTYSSLRYLRSGFSESVVPAPGLRAAAAYRLWLNDHTVQVMMWVDAHNTTPAGREIGEILIYGSDFHVWQESKNQFTFALSGPQLLTGKAHLLSALRWLVHHQDPATGGTYLSKHVKLSEVDFGWQITSTGGTALDLDVTGFSLTSASKGAARPAQPAAVGGGSGLGWALAGGVIAVFVAMFLVTLLMFARLDRASQGRTLSSMFDRYSPRNDSAPSTTSENQGKVAAVAVDAMTRVMTTGSRDRLARRLDLAGSTRRPAEWAVLGTCLGVGIATMLSLVTSYVFIGVIGGAVIGWLAMRLSLSVRILRRRATFSDQLPDMLQLIASTLQAGFSLPQALDAVIRQENQPAAAEFSRALAEARIGADLDNALEAVANRMDSDDLRWTVMAIRIQQGVGGNLAEVLFTIADTIRERAFLRRQVRALSAEGRLSAYILVALPLVVATWLFVSSTTYMRPLYTTTLGEVMLASAAGLLMFGAFWMHRTIKVEV